MPTKYPNDIEDDEWETLTSGGPCHVAWLEREGWKVEEDAKPPEPWKPEGGETYWYVDSLSQVLAGTFFHGNALLDIGNCYRTREEAEKAAERVRKAYVVKP